jgi:hypothetical protein
MNALAGCVRLRGAKPKPVGVGLVPTQCQTSAAPRTAGKMRHTTHKRKTKIFSKKIILRRKGSFFLKNGQCGAKYTGGGAKKEPPSSQARKRPSQKPI